MGNKKDEIEVAEKMLCTVEESQALFEKLGDMAIKGNSLNLDIACVICEIEDSRAYVEQGYNSFEDFGERYFNKKLTQMKVFRIVCSTFGAKKKDGSYCIPNKSHVAQYGINALNEIQKLMKARECTLAELEDADIVNPTMSVRDLKEAVKLQKLGVDGYQKAIEEKQAREAEKAREVEKAETIETTLKKANDEKSVVIDEYVDTLRKIFKVLSDNNVTDKDARKQVLEMVNHALATKEKIR